MSFTVCFLKQLRGGLFPTSSTRSRICATCNSSCGTKWSTSPYITSMWWRLAGHWREHPTTPTFSSLRARRTFKTMVKCKLFMSPSNPLQHFVVQSSTGVGLEWCFCGGVVVFLWWCGGVLVVVFCGCVLVVVFLWWCGGVFVVVGWCFWGFVVVFCGCVVVVVFLWWCVCGGVFVVVLWFCFCGGVFVVAFLWWCCGSVFVVVFLWWWCGGVFFCGGVLAVVFLLCSCALLFFWWCGGVLGDVFLVALTACIHACVLCMQAPGPRTWNETVRERQSMCILM